jgi:hypothetical protein
MATSFSQLESAEKNLRSDASRTFSAHVQFSFAGLTLLTRLALMSVT